ncbi:MAG: hypothetical protein EOO01_33365 [Chitinophagaceae bacterium]|nr:MAG: hypothetical protein EOO01_33365 [Chitinophagaceae bacterium]
MADQEVIKHTKKIYKIWNSNEHSLWQKVKEFLMEILIIVFAVSLSIWLHGRSEQSHQEQEVKAFLQGIEQDLQSDITEMTEDRSMYVMSQKAYRYIRTLGRNEAASRDSINFYSRFLFNQTGLIPNDGRFEGFKSSGKIGSIENLELQNEIMNLYQEEIPSLVVYTNFYSAQKAAIALYFDQHLTRTSDSTNNMLELFSKDEAFNKAEDLTQVRSIVSQYDKCIATMKRIIALIKKEYGD